MKSKRATKRYVREQELKRKQEQRKTHPLLNFEICGVDEEWQLVHEGVGQLKESINEWERIEGKGCLIGQLNTLLEPLWGQFGVQFESVENEDRLNVTAKVDKTRCLQHRLQRLLRILEEAMER